MKKYPDLSIAVVDDRDLDPRDAAFANAVYGTVMRRWLTLRFLIEHRLRGEWRSTNPEARAALMVGAAQIVLLRSVPAYAAVSEAVSWTNSRLSSGAAGMVNAVLRSLAAQVGDEPQIVDRWSADEPEQIPLEDGRAIVVPEMELPEDPLRRLSVLTSHPMNVLHDWARHFGLREVRALATHGLMRPPTILNTQHAKAELPATLIEHDAPGHHVFQGEHHELVELLRERDDLWVQDPASSLAVQSVIDLQPGLVVDSCAGQGTKTRQLAAAFPNAKIIATDIDRPRHRTLAQTFSGHERVEVVPYDALMEYAGQADLVLLDVPCSNTGVLGRRVEARYRYDPGRTDSLVSTQRQIVADSIRLIATERKRGSILYSTCSLDPRENEEIARWASKWHALAVGREHRRLPAGQPSDPPTSYTDGSYAALLQ